MKTRAWHLAVFVFVVAAGTLSSGCGSASSKGDLRADLATVKRGNLSISVTETANLRAARETRVKCEMEGKSTVIWLIPEGTKVKKGDKLVELDASSQIERRAQQEIAVEKSEAAVVNAEKELEILKKQNDADLKAAQNNMTFAKMDEEKFYGKLLPDGKREMGEKEQSLEAEREQIKLAKAKLKLAIDRLEASKRLRKQDFITENELEEAQLDHDSKKSAVILAENRLELLRDYTHKKTEMELAQRLKDAELELERVKARCEAKMVQAVADLNSKKAERDLATERLQNLKTQIHNSVVRAPSPGIVVYAYEGDWRRRQYIEEGATVRERQNLVILPDTSKMVAEMRVHEAMASKVKPGQAAFIEVDTLERALSGTVLRRAPLPDSGSRHSNPDLKVYKTTVSIHGNNADMALRPGMSATGTILIDELVDVLQIPEQAVNRDRAVNYVWLETGAGYEARPVAVGESNATYIEVKSGLEEGQKVYLAMPPGAKPPDLPQPETKKPAAQPKNAVKDIAKENTKPEGNGDNPKVAGQGKDGQGDGGRRGFDQGEMTRRMAANPSYQAFLALLKKKLPRVHAQVEQDPLALWRDRELRSRVEADAELKAAYDRYRAEMRSRRGRRGDGDGRVNSQGDTRGDTQGDAQGDTHGDGEGRRRRRNDGDRRDDGDR